MERARDLLVRVGLTRRNKWERPTLVDSLLASPLRWLAAILFQLVLFLRGRPASPPPGRPPVRVVCISDTHEHTVPVPDGDLLIHAGDLTSAGTAEAIQKQLDWLDSLPHRHKVFVCGNHDNWFDPRSRKQVDRETGRRPDLKSLIFLQQSSVALEFAGGRRLVVYGAGNIPAIGGPDHAFQYTSGNPPWRNNIPKETDILVTHTPPYGHMDLGLGCPALLKEVWLVRPRLHVFGHVHWGHGRQSIYWDECQRAYESLLLRPPRGLVRDLFPHAGWWDALRVVYYGITSVLWKWLMLGPSGNFGTVMVNAAQMWGNTGKMKPRAEIVLI